MHWKYIKYNIHPQTNDTSAVINWLELERLTWGKQNANNLYSCVSFEERWKPITATIGTHVIICVRHSLSDTDANTQTHTTTGCDQNLNILSAPSTSCVKTWLPQQHRKSVRKDIGVSWDMMRTAPQWAELNEKMMHILQSILIELRFNTTSFLLPCASWEEKSVWQALDSIYSLPHKTLSQLSECSNLHERVSTNVTICCRWFASGHCFALWSFLIDTRMWVDG